MADWSAVVWSAVSSRPQSEKDSLEQQVADGLALCGRKGWPVVEVLTVPGESRDYIDLADALEGLDARLRPGEVNAYRRLVELLEGRAFQVLVCRSRDRLGRTDALVAGIEERCRRAGALVWSMAMPPSGSEAGDLYVSAVERAGAQRELIELQRRNRYGMDGRLKRGDLIAATVPFGYTTEVVQVGRRAVRRAVLVPAEAGAYQEAAAGILGRTLTEVDILERFRRQFPDRAWPPSTISTTMRNPFHVGLQLRRRRRNQGEEALLKVYQPEGPSLFDDPGWPEAEAILLARAGRARGTNSDAAGNQKIHLVALGNHEPAIAFGPWLDLQREMERRVISRRPQARNSLWAGMARCGLCDAPMYYVRLQPAKTRARAYHYYHCSRKGKRGGCPNPAIQSEALTEGVAVWLARLYDRLASGVDGLVPPEPAAVDLLAGIVAQRADLLAQRERLETMAISGRISLEAFDGRAAALDGALADVEVRLAREQEVLANRERAGARLLALGEMVDDLPGRLLAADPLAANRWLREVIERVVVIDKQVAEVRLRV